MFANVDVYIISSFYNIMFLRYFSSDFKIYSPYVQSTLGHEMGKESSSNISYLRCNLLSLQKDPHAVIPRETDCLRNLN